MAPEAKHRSDLWHLGQVEIRNRHTVTEVAVDIQRPRWTETSYTRHPRKEGKPHVSLRRSSQGSLFEIQEVTRCLGSRLDRKRLLATCWRLWHLPWWDGKQAGSQVFLQEGAVLYRLFESCLIKKVWWCCKDIFLSAPPPHYVISFVWLAHWRENQAEGGSWAS